MTEQNEYFIYAIRHNGLTHPIVPTIHYNVDLFDDIFLLRIKELCKKCDVLATEHSVLYNWQPKYIRNMDDRKNAAKEKQKQKQKETLDNINIGKETECVIKDETENIHNLEIQTQFIKTYPKVSRYFINDILDTEKFNSPKRTLDTFMEIAFNRREKYFLDTTNKELYIKTEKLDADDDINCNKMNNLQSEQSKYLLHMITTYKYYMNVIETGDYSKKWWLNLSTKYDFNDKTTRDYNYTLIDERNISWAKAIRKKILSRHNTKTYIIAVGLAHIIDSPITGNNLIKILEEDFEIVIIKI